MESFELYKGMKNIPISILFIDQETGANLDISGYTTSHIINYLINNKDSGQWAASISNLYYLTYTIPELNYSGLWEIQGILESPGGVVIKSKILQFSVKKSLV